MFKQILIILLYFIVDNNLLYNLYINKIYDNETLDYLFYY